MIYLFTTVIVHSYVKERESIHEKVDGLAIFQPWPCNMVTKPIPKSAGQMYS